MTSRSECVAIIPSQDGMKEMDWLSLTHVCTNRAWRGMAGPGKARMQSFSCNPWQANLSEMVEAQ